MLSVSWGTVLWSAIAFLIVFFILAKTAWGPILKAIRERESSIDDALKSAERARNEMANLQASNEQLLREARIERDNMIKEARETKDQIISQAKTQAEEEKERIVNAARETIQAEKAAAIAEIKNQVATLSVDIAEKIIREKLSSEEKQNTLMSNMLQEVKLN